MSTKLYPTDSGLTHLLHELSPDGGTYPTILFCKLLAVSNAQWRNFARCKIHFAPKSCVMLFWQRYCTALQQRASAKLAALRRGRHLYLAGRPSRWASAHILVFSF